MSGAAPARTGSPGAAEEWRRHWPVELGASIAIATGYAIWMYTASVFVIPLQQAFGWSRGEIALVSYAHILSGFSAPLIGAAIDRLGVRPILLSSMAMVGLIYIGLANMGGSFLTYYLLTTALVVIGLGTSGIAVSRVISAWFDASRGLALAVSRIGIALAGALVPMLNYALMAQFGWQAGYYAMAAIALLIGLPSCWTLVREPPRASHHGASADALPRLGSRRWWAMIGQLPALIIILTAGLSYAALSGLLSQLQPLLVSKGLDAGTAAQVAGLLALSALAGALVTGALVDRFWAPMIGCVFLLGPVIGCAILLTGSPGLAGAALAIFLIGFAQGAEFDLMAYLIGRYLGIGSFSTLYGVCVLAMSLATAAGGLFFAFSYDASGSYDLALIAALACFALAAALYLCLGPYPEKATDNVLVSTSC